jgi:hypothetical protein
MISLKLSVFRLQTKTISGTIFEAHRTLHSFIDKCNFFEIVDILSTQRSDNYFLLL